MIIWTPKWTSKHKSLEDLCLPFSKRFVEWKKVKDSKGFFFVCNLIIGRSFLLRGSYQPVIQSTYTLMSNDIRPLISLDYITKSFFFFSYLKQIMCVNLVVKSFMGILMVLKGFCNSFKICGPSAFPCITPHVCSLLYKAQQSCSLVI